MKTAVALILLAFSGAAPAADRASLAKGNAYFSECVAGKDYYTVCLGYFMGMADAPIMNTGKVPEEAVYCPRPGVTYEQYRDLFHKYLQENPAHRSVSTHMLFLMAMNNAFPCTSSPFFTIDRETGGVYISVPKPRAGS